MHRGRSRKHATLTGQRVRCLRGFVFRRISRRAEPRHPDAPRAVIQHGFVSRRSVQSFSTALSRDGSALLFGDSVALYVCCAASGLLRRTIGGPGRGRGPLQFYETRQVFVSEDDYVFVAEFSNRRVQVLTPRLDFHCFIGFKKLKGPSGVCADATNVFVADSNAGHISAFARCDGSFLRRIGSYGRSDGELIWPRSLCLLGKNCRIAVVDSNTRRISVFSVHGEFIRSVTNSTIVYLNDVACFNGSDELAVTDTIKKRIYVFSASGETLHVLQGCSFSNVAICDGTIFARSFIDQKCIVFE